MTSWRPIQSAPRDVVIDILAKTWLSEKDEFIYRRFPNCRWHAASTSNIPEFWSGVADHWRAVGWTPVPDLTPPGDTV